MGEILFPNHGELFSVGRIKANMNTNRNTRGIEGKGEVVAVVAMIGGTGKRSSPSDSPSSLVYTSPSTASGSWISSLVLNRTFRGLGNRCSVNGPAFAGSSKSSRPISVKTDFLRCFPSGEVEVVDESREDESENLKPCLDCLDNVSLSEPDDWWISEDGAETVFVAAPAMLVDKVGGVENRRAKVSLVSREAKVVPARGHETLGAAQKRVEAGSSEKRGATER